MNIYETQVRTFYSEIWNNRNLAEIPNILHENFLFRGSLGQEKKGHEGFKEYVNYVHSALSHYTCIIEDMVVQPEKVFAKMLFTGIHNSEFMGFQATGEKVSWPGAALFTFSGSKVTSLWVLGDLKTLEMQLNKRVRSQ